MSMIFDARLFAAFVRTRRGERSLRPPASEIGTISPATLLRIEQEEVLPDLPTFLALCEWLQLSHRTFLRSDDARTLPLVELVERELCADGVLASQIIDTFMVLYRAVRAG
jgi:transcriptional regulator with XRE-family HTH domain